MEALAARGVDLTIVEMGDRMVPRMMTPKAGNMIKRWVEKKGIRVRTSAGVKSIDDGTGDAPLAVTLTTGEVLPCDVVIVAAGVIPNLDFLQGTSIQQGRGIRVDDGMRTNVEGVYAAGDVAEGDEQVAHMMEGTVSIDRALSRAAVLTHPTRPPSRPTSP
jgi:pyruvate/2-oxoglutarate dehydrogenase complex dihydrolipoamide dehydrogenase (E3) component